MLYVTPEFFGRGADFACRRVGTTDRFGSVLQDRGHASLLALPGTPMAGTPTGVRVGVAPARRLFSRSGTAGDLSVGVPRHDTKKPHGAGGPRRDKEV
ncbi:hypothetical protein GGP80_000093 [Salinibacter ruber]|nr:hypothetical protein [Salinibacter ruber]MCS3934134.1 hypothetical protein [Salinibacter ruber]MCS4042238.1 hypothetical protein [Salinibacter ruber]